MRIERTNARLMIAAHLWGENYLSRLLVRIAELQVQNLRAGGGLRIALPRSW